MASECEHPLILGIGHPERGDDAAGLLVAQRLSELGIPAVSRGCDALSLIEIWKDTKRVIVIDAVVTGAPPGTVACWDGRTLQVEPNSFRCSTHSFGLGEALELARLTHDLPQQLVIYGIEGHQFDRGSRPSLEVIEAAESLSQELYRQYHSALPNPNGQ